MFKKNKQNSTAKQSREPPFLLHPDGIKNEKENLNNK
jgi:hypothetical protein